MDEDLIDDESEIPIQHKEPTTEFLPFDAFARTFNGAVAAERRRILELIGTLTERGDKPSEILEQLVKQLSE